jgi:hypothetical protein
MRERMSPASRMQTSTPMPDPLPEILRRCACPWIRIDVYSKWLGWSKQDLFKSVPVILPNDKSVEDIVLTASQSYPEYLAISKRSCAWCATLNLIMFGQKYSGTICRWWCDFEWYGRTSWACGYTSNSLPHEWVRVCKGDIMYVLCGTSLRGAKMIRDTKVTVLCLLGSMARQVCFQKIAGLQCLWWMASVRFRKVTQWSNGEDGCILYFICPVYSCSRFRMQ